MLFIRGNIRQTAKFLSAPPAYSGKRVDIRLSAVVVVFEIVKFGVTKTENRLFIARKFHQIFPIREN